MSSHVIVLGAGVIGLSAAVRLAEAGHRVDVLARDLPLETTSAVAAAIWYPYKAAPIERVSAWSGTSYGEFARLADDDPESGVRMRWGWELRREPTSPPEWANAIPDFERHVDPRPGFGEGWRFRAPVIDMGVYLPWLSKRFERLGGTITRAAFGRLPNRADVVVNAAGLAARRLADDDSVTPIRGQVVVVEQSGLTEWTICPAESPESDPIYIVPRLNEIVIGGTAETGSFDRSHDPDTAQRLLDRANRLVPGIADAPIRRHRVGLRPARPSVRLEAEYSADGRMIVHSYGHGGSGVTVSWGCADEVAATIADRSASE